MHVYILGICGTFMGSLAILAREMGYKVSGCDVNVYPPMSTQLERAGIQLDQGFATSHLDCEPDLIIIGNAMSRGNPLVEYVLDRGLPYTSGPQFLHDYVLKDKWVLAVAGTHGKTTTSAMLAFILDYADMKPGFLIGGVVQDFPFSARMGESPFFVVEADEYDTAFFDKRSKFVHYSPRTVILNNLEFDHADIFDDLNAIKKQFHHLLRIVPSTGRVVFNAAEPNLFDVLARGCWSEKVSFGEQGDWQAENTEQGIVIGNPSQSNETWLLNWQLLGEHNTQNALAAIAAAQHVGVKPALAIEALSQFKGVKRRMEKIAEVAGIHLYDDFAHHPTAIATTLAGVKQKYSGRVIAVIEPRSNTMKMGVHKDILAASVEQADVCYWFVNDKQGWSLPESAGQRFSEIDALIADIVEQAQAGDYIVFMSNGGFSGIHGKVKQALEQRYE